MPAIVVGAFLWIVMAGIVSGLAEAPIDAIAQPKTAWVKPFQAAFATLTSRPPAAATASPVAQRASTESAADRSSAAATEAPTVFAVIGDFGTGNRDARAVAREVASWDPQFVVTTGDNYYTTAGGSGTGCYANSVGKLYGKWTDGAFYPSLGNHDYDAAPALASYTNYFSLPGGGRKSSSGNERYYDFVRGPVHFFVLNSNDREPDGTSSTSEQARWLKAQLAQSTAKFKVVVYHHPAYTSGDTHGPAAYMRWPFAEWGADVVLSGHEHIYERVMHDGIVYFVNGTGGAARYGFGRAVVGSVCRYSGDFGAQKVSATDASMVFEFFSVGGGLVDRYEITPRAHHAR